ncbi:MAG: EI24 domain-containing protein [Acidobacteria bacterium]|nr:EI24 domain-containing protein [Acidobacteriota bacterium]
MPLTSRFPISGFFAGLALHWEGARLLLGEPKLRRLSWIPVLISALTLSATLVALALYVSEIHSFVTSWMPHLEAGRWYTWLWIGPGRLALAILAGILLLAVAGCALVVAFLIANLLAAPVHEVISQRVEAVVGGSRSGDTGGVMQSLRDGARALIEELKRTLFFLVVSLAIAVIGIVPGGQLVAAPALTLFTILFLPLDYASYTLDRRGISFRAKRRWIGRHWPAMLGFGSGAFVTILVPGLNFLMMPVLVTSGTLLAMGVRIDREKD